MTTREEIREGIARNVHINQRIWAKIFKTEDPHNCKWEELSEYHRELYLAGADIIMKQEHSQGVVIKVRRELPDKIIQEIDDALERWALRPSMAGVYIAKILKEAGYEAVEPLMGEK